MPYPPSDRQDASPTRVRRGFPAAERRGGPALDLDRFVPPPRFGDVSLSDYVPRHPTQARAVERVTAFAREVPPAARAGRFRPPWRPRRPEGRGLYLDGGFGVGKTHLLAAAWHASPLPLGRKRYLSFGELVAALGVLGREAGREAFADTDLLCIDEFELDDPGNTLIVSTFLAARFRAGGHVLTTSNTPPASQGEGRFAAEDFRREIQGIAARFEVLPIDGPDARADTRLASFPTKAGLDAAAAEAPGTVVRVTGDELLAELARHHPIRYAALLEGVDTLLVDDLRPMADQNTALRFVHFVDKLYDLGTGLRASADVPPEGLFAGEYRDGAYAKKHDRCLSRLSELVTEPLGGAAAGRRPASAAARP